MVNQKLFDFIKEEIAKGTPKEQITRILLDKGWQQMQIDEAFKTNDSSLIKKIRRVLPILILIILSFAAISIGPWLLVGDLYFSAFAGGPGLVGGIILLILFIFIPFSLLILMVWKNLARIKRTSLSGAKPELIRLLPILLLNTIYFMFFSVTFGELLGYYHSNIILILSVVSVLFFLHIIVLLPKLVFPSDKLHLRRAVLMISILVLVSMPFSSYLLSPLAKTANTIPALEEPVNDEKRVSALLGITSNIDAYFKDNQKLPNTLSNLKLYEDDLTDPAVKEFMRKENYKINSKTEYSLCTIFETNTLDKTFNDFNKLYKHGKGYYCVSLTVPEINIARLPTLTNSTTNDPSLSKITWKTYVNNKIGFTFKYSSTSTLLKEGPDTQSMYNLIAVNGDEDKEILLTYFDLDKPEGGKRILLNIYNFKGNLDQFIEYAKNEPKEDCLPNRQTEKDIINNITMEIFTRADKNNHYCGEKVGVYFVGKGYGFVLSYGGDEPIMPSEIIKSFRFTDPISTQSANQLNK